MKRLPSVCGLAKEATSPPQHSFPRLGGNGGTPASGGEGAEGSEFLLTPVPGRVGVLTASALVLVGASALCLASPHTLPVTVGGTVPAL